MDRAKPFCIAKREVWEAYKQVKANREAAYITTRHQRFTRVRLLKTYLTE